MKIQNHRLVDVDQKPLSGDAADTPPRYIVIHYTEGGSVSGSHTFLKSVNLSYHVIVARNGDLIQCVPFHRTGRHAGKSNWKGRNGINPISIGISAANWGVQAAAQGVSNPLSGRHKHESEIRRWERYPAEQVAAIRAVCEALIETYPSIVDIIGHDDVAPGRKVDPGPAFPMEKLHALVPGRTADRAPRFVVKVAAGDTLRLREEPSADAKELARMESGTEVGVLATAYRNGKIIPWVSVEIDENGGHAGFVNRDFLKRI